MKKKMLFICAAVLSTASIASAIESANIVGYQKLAAKGVALSCGPTFVTVGHLANPASISAEWCLANLKVTGMDPESDVIQFLDVNTAKTIIRATYIDPILIDDYGVSGWVNLDTGLTIDNQKFSISEAFLCYLSDPGSVEFTFAGEVLAKEMEIDVSSQISPFIANYLPVNLYMHEVLVEGMDPETDVIQFLDASTAKTTIRATYIDPSLIDDYGVVGWVNLDTGLEMDDDTFFAGAAFLGYFPSKTVKFTFPNPLSLSTPRPL